MSGKLFGSSTSDRDFRQMTDKLPEYAFDVLHGMCKNKGKEYICQVPSCTGNVTFRDRVGECSECHIEWPGYSPEEVARLWKER